MNGMQCDNCRSFKASGAVGWLVLQEIIGTGLLGQPAGEIVGTFCSLRCIMEWSYAKEVISAAADAKGESGD